MNIRKLVAASMLALLAAGASFAEEQSDGKRLLSLDDFGKMEGVYYTRIAQDGRSLIYEQDGQVYLLEDGQSEASAITSSAAQAWASRWSNDGKSIYFLSRRDDNTQIYRLRLGTPGEAEQVSYFSNDVASLNLSPDESRVLVAASDNDLKEADPDAGPQPFVITRRQFKRDAGEGYIVDGDDNHLYVYDIASREMSQLASGDFAESAAAWSPDGQNVVFVSNREEDPDAGY